MIDPQQFLIFIASGWLLNLTPGPDVLYIVNQASRNGMRAGVMAVLGIVSGCFVHVLAAALGVGALLAASSTAFILLKWIGAAYLVWMGIKLFWTSFQRTDRDMTQQHQQIAQELSTPRSDSANMDFWWVYRQGFLTNVLNPKVALFFLAFVPQFIAPTAEHKVLTFLLLGLLFNLNSLPINFGYAWLAVWASRRLALMQRSLRWMDRAAGFMFIGFGLKLALADHPQR